MITLSVDVTSDDVTSTHAVVRTEMEGLGQERVGSLRLRRQSM